MVGVGITIFTASDAINMGASPNVNSTTLTQIANLMGSRILVDTVLNLQPATAPIDIQHIDAFAILQPEVVVTKPFLRVGGGGTITATEPPIIAQPIGILESPPHKY